MSRLCYVCVLLLMTACIVPAISVSAADLGILSAETVVLEDWVVLDGRSVSAWEKGHLPGAFSFSWKDYTETDPGGVKYRIKSPEQLAEALSRLGIDEQTAVLVYGDADSSWGGEGWIAWVLTWLGHRAPVRLLDGGIHAWGKLHPLEKKGYAVESQMYHVRLDLSVQVDVKALRSGRLWQKVDTRSTLEWFRYRLPDACHISWKKFYQEPDKKIISRQQLVKLLTNEGIDPGKPVAYYCTGGIRSAFAWFVHRAAGLPVAVNFEGGTEAWQKSRKN